MRRKQETHCPRCGGDRHRGRCKKAAAEAPAQPTSEPARAVLLEVPPTFGFRASVVDHVLRIEQDSSPDETGAVATHQIDLSIHEVRRLLAWLESEAADAGEA